MKFAVVTVRGMVYEVQAFAIAAEKGDGVGDARVVVAVKSVTRRGEDFILKF